MTATILSITEHPPVAQVQTGARDWTNIEKIAFRIAFVFFLLMVVPLDGTWYVKLVHPKSFFWFLSSLTGYRPNFINLTSESGKWGLASFSSFGIALIIAIVAGGVWSVIARNSKRTEYNALYYWLRVLLRYRVALGVIAYGFLKFYPMQMPSPSVSNLATNYGDFNAYKIYWQVVGVSLWYEITLGFVEIVGAVLMFFRRTTALGAALNAGVLYNITHANLAYDGAVHVYSSIFVIYSLFLLVQYAPDLWRLLIKQEDVVPHRYVPTWDKKWKANLALTAKYAFVFIFTIVYGVLRYDVHYNQHYFKEPATPGLANAAGYYNVTEFRLNNKVIPYSPLDSVRWANVQFEKWSTLVYQVHKPFSISLANGSPSDKDLNRDFELAGIAGGHRFLYYNADTTKGILYLQDKNRHAPIFEGDQPKAASTKKAKVKEDKLVWHYQRPSANRIIISGINEHRDSIYVILDRAVKSYPLKLNRSNNTINKSSI